MVTEVAQFLQPKPGMTLLDMTLGMGGHARHLIEAGVVGIDRDESALERAAHRLAPYEGSFRLIWGQMSQADELLAAEGIKGVDGCLIDAGLSMDQLLDEARGLSVHSRESLDMRLDRSDPDAVTGYDVVNGYLEKDLVRVFSVVGRKREARRVAHWIVRTRDRRPIQTAAELAELIAAHIVRGKYTRPIDAAPYLMAVRIETNDELTELTAGIEMGCSLLLPTSTATIVTLTWHSAEHRVSKHTLRRLAHPCTCPPALPCVCGKTPTIRVLTPKLLYPSEEEVHSNPAARSARLNAAVKLSPADRQAQK